MARLSQRGAAGGISQSPDPSAELNRLVSRLQQSVLYADHDREKRLRASEYERSRVGINLDYARTLLMRLEQDAVGIKVHARRQEAQADLNGKREVLDDIAERLRDLEEMRGEDDDGSSDGEDVLGEILDTPSESLDSRTKSSGTDDDDGSEASAAAAPASAPTVQPPQASTSRSGTAPATTPAKAAPATSPLEIPSQTIRARNTASSQARPPPTAGATAATTTATPQNPRDLLFAGSGRTSPPPSSLSAVAASEAVLDRQRAEQEELASSLLSMAAALKQSSRAFGASLEAEQDVLRDAGSGLDKTAGGMDAAHRRMGTLRRMAEGQGWWGRILLYAWIAGLMVAMLVVVFATPKLRF